MKRVLVCNLTPRGGMLHYASQFCNELSLRGDISLKVAIAPYHKNTLYHKNISFIKIRTHPDLKNFIFDSLNIFYQIYFLSKIIIFRPQIVHFMDNHPWYIPYVYVFKLFGVEVFTTQHDPTLHSGEAKSLTGKIAGYTNAVLRKKSDKLIVHGDILKTEVIKKYHIPAEHIISIPHGAYTFFSQYAQGLAVQKNTFLFFGRILDYKGLDVLLHALEYVKNQIPDFHLIIAGPGDISAYQEMIQKYEDNIELYNFHIEAEDAYKYFEISEFVVLPYKDASGSGVIPVAYCFKKPVLVTDVGELSSVVLEGKTGYIIAPNNVKLLGEKIVEMLGDTRKLQEMGESGYEFSLKELSWKPIIDKIYS